MKKLFLFLWLVILIAGAFAQTPATGSDAKAKVVFYYSRPAPLKNCLEQVSIQIDGATAHVISQWHIWQAELPAGTHNFSDDSHKEKGVTAVLAAGQTYYYQLEWRKGFGFPKCENFYIRVDDMKPKDAQKATALLGKPGVDETTSSPAAAQVVAKSTGQKLLVESVPERADIEIDGNFMGNTPSAIELAPGEHLVTVSKTGYKSWQRKIKLAGGDVKLSTELERATAQ